MSLTEAAGYDNVYCLARSLSTARDSGYTFGFFGGLRCEISERALAIPASQELTAEDQLAPAESLSDVNSCQLGVSRKLKYVWS